MPRSANARALAPRWAEVYGLGHLGAIRALAASLAVVSSALGPAAMGWLIDGGVSMEVIALFHGLPGVRDFRNRGGLPAPGRRVAERVRAGSRPSGSGGLQNHARLPYIPMVSLPDVAADQRPRPGAFVLPGDSSVERLGSPRGPKETRVDSR